MKLKTNIPEKAIHRKELSEIKDLFVKSRIEMLLDSWCIQKMGEDEYLFFKHIISPRKSVLYQLVLSGGDDDGIYEFELVNKNLSFETIEVDNKSILKVNTISNYDLAGFDKSEFNKKLFLDNEDDRVTLKKYLRELSSFDSIILEKYDGLNIELKQKPMGEIKFKKKIAYYFKYELKTIKTITFKRKKSYKYISRLDLGSKNFKEELIKRGFVTEEEYEMYTKASLNQRKKYYDSLKRVEIV